MRKPIIAITAGDPGGIGPEVIAKTFQKAKLSKDVCYLIIGAVQPFEFLAKEHGYKFPMHCMTRLDYKALKVNQVNFLDVTDLALNYYQSLEELATKRSNGHKKKKLVFDIGKISKVNACIAFATLKVATDLAGAGYVEGIVTAPVNKTTMRLLNKNFHGHTDYLATASGAPKYAMMFVHDRLKVTLATIHVPLKKVNKLISKELVFEKIRLTDQFLRTYFNLSKPKIAVCALNPHGQETGEEDEEEITPAVKQARSRKVEVVGPLSADQLFFDAYEGRYDAVVSMYHDQGLAPFKMIAFRDGVNVTLGLPFVRTSPDHGTAFDIAYQDKADHSSMNAALKLAKNLVIGK